MAVIVMFDTLSFADRLKEAGVAPRVAEAQARAMVEAPGDTDGVTKADFRAVKLELESAPRIIIWVMGFGIAWLTAIHMPTHAFRSA